MLRSVISFISEHAELRADGERAQFFELLPVLLRGFVAIGSHVEKVGYILPAFERKSIAYLLFTDEAEALDIMRRNFVLIRRVIHGAF